MPVVTRSCGRNEPRRRIEDPTPARTCRTAAKRRKDLSDEESEKPPKKKANTNAKQQKPSSKSFCEKNNKGFKNSKIPRRCVTEKRPMKNVISNNKEEDNVPLTADINKAKSPETTNKRCEAQETPATAVAARTRSYSALRRSYRQKQKRQNPDVDKKGGKESPPTSTSGDSSVFENVEGDSTEVKEMETDASFPINKGESSTSIGETEMKELSSNEERDDDQYHKTKFHEMVQRLKQIQDQFSQAHQNTHKNLTAYDAFVKELKNSLDLEKRKNATIEQELSQTREQLLIAQKETETIKTNAQNGEHRKSMNTTCASQDSSQNEERNQSEDELEKVDKSTLLAMVKFYAGLTGITLSNDSPSSNTELFESYCCAYRPKGPTGHVMQFRLTYDKEFEEIEYSPNFQSPDKGDVQTIPGFFKENMYFNPDQAHSFLARLIKAIKK